MTERPTDGAEPDPREPVWVRPGGHKPYPIVVGPGSLRCLPRYLPDSCSRVVIIADENVAGFHGGAARAAFGGAAEVDLLTMPAGEAHKTRETKARLEDAMFAADVDRHALVVGLGGGVSTDMAGFVAATFKRGIPWLAAPTSLLGAVDASVGGKVGVDTPAGKNLVGAFHHPEAVVVDTNLLDTLPEAEWANGRAEMLKHGVVADPEVVVHLCAHAGELRDARVLADAIARSVRIKADVVSRDARESDLRQILNFGHTVGHALELASSFTLPHGLAVAIGMAVESDIAVAMKIMSAGERDRLVDALERLQLPSRLPDHVDRDDVLRNTRADKKGRDGAPRYVLPRAVGAMAVGRSGYAHEVPDRIVRRALERACGA